MPMELDCHEWNAFGALVAGNQIQNIFFSPPRNILLIQFLKYIEEIGLNETEIQSRNKRTSKQPL